MLKRSLLHGLRVRGARLILVAAALALLVALAPAALAEAPEVLADVVPGQSDDSDESAEDEASDDPEADDAVPGDGEMVDDAPAPDADVPDVDVPDADVPGVLPEVTPSLPGADAPTDGGPTTWAVRDVDVFARVPTPPGLPEGIVVDRRERTVYTATNPGGNGPTGPPYGADSEVLAYGADGDLERRFPIEGQNKASVALPSYGLQAITADRDGFLYVLDKAPARVIRLDPRTGEQTDYARFSDVPPCRAAPDDTQCSDTSTDLRAFPDGVSFAPDGSMYVTDFQQSLIWRVSEGGGRPEIAYTDERFDSGMGPNGIQVVDRDELTFVTSQNAGEAPGMGSLYRLDIRRDGQLGKLDEVYTSNPGDGPDGFAVARSGNVYINFFMSNQIAVIAPDGDELERITTQPGQEIPFDSPASGAFVGERLLVTNHAVNTRAATNFAILDVGAGEPGLPIFRPEVDVNPGSGNGRGNGNGNGRSNDDDGGTTEPIDGIAPRGALSTAEVQGRAVLRTGLSATCTSTEAGSCSVVVSISRRAARSLGLRGRGPRHVIGRAAVPILGTAPADVRVSFSRRVAAAIAAHGGRTLRVRLDGLVTDSAGNRSTMDFSFVIRG